MKNEDINEIMKYNGNDEEFSHYNEKLKESKKLSTKINLYYNRYIELYSEIVDNNKNKYGKMFNDRELIYEGFFKDNKCNGKGTLYNNGKKVYDGFFENNKYDGIGIEYFSNKNRKRKAKYKEGKILEQCYGILYNDKNGQEYSGLLLKGKPKEGKNIKYYGEKDHLIYIGDFYNYKYNGKGILFFEDGKNIFFNGIFEDDYYGNGILYYIDGNKNYEGYFENNKYDGNGTLFYKKDNKIYYVGSFENGYFNYGILYDPYQKKIYEGEYKNNIPKEGKNIELYNLDTFLKYKGDFYDFKYHGYGKLYNDNSHILLYEGDFI